MPVYNAERFICEAIDSILKQTYDNWELILVNDASTDCSAVIASEYAASDLRIRFYDNPMNLGVAKTRNRAIHETRGEYIACLDNDDVALPDRIAAQVTFLRDHPDHGLVASDIEIIDENSRLVAVRTYPHRDEEIRKSMLRVNPVANPASMFRRSVFDALGGFYDESVCPVEDYDFVLRVATHYKIANLERRLTRYRISSTQAKNVYLKRTLKMTLAIQKKHLKSLTGDSLFNQIYRLGLSFLLLLPSPWILWLFKRMSYSSSRE
jgi:glycosyltransferase involved in cell wall biosynthesis